MYFCFKCNLSFEAVRQKYNIVKCPTCGSPRFVVKREHPFGRRLS